LVFKLSVWCGAEGCVSGLRAAAAAGQQPPNNTLELLMMDIIVPETCWASNKIWNENNLLHLVGILLPHWNTLKVHLCMWDKLQKVMWNALQCDWKCGDYQIMYNKRTFFILIKIQIESCLFTSTCWLKVMNFVHFIICR